MREPFPVPFDLLTTCLRSIYERNAAGAIEQAGSG